MTMKRPTTTRRIRTAASLLPVMLAVLAAGAPAGAAQAQARTAAPPDPAGHAGHGHAPEPAGHADHASPAGPGPSAPGSAPRVDGEVRQLDPDRGRITLRHGPIPNLDMPAMTMIFRVADPKWFDGLKPGDRVTFTAEQVDGANTVTGIELRR